MTDTDRWSPSERPYLRPDLKAWILDQIRANVAELKATTDERNERKGGQ